MNKTKLVWCMIHPGAGQRGGEAAENRQGDCPDLVSVSWRGFSIHERRWRPPYLCLSSSLPQTWPSSWTLSVREDTKAAEENASASFWSRHLPQLNWRIPCYHYHFIYSVFTWGVFQKQFEFQFKKFLWCQYLGITFKKNNINHIYLFNIFLTPQNTYTSPNHNFIDRDK